MTNFHTALDAANAADRYEALRGRREMARGRETWCDCCREWVLLRAIEQHLTTDDHASAQLRADAWKM